MAFKLSKKSLARLEGVDPQLVTVVKLAIHKTKVDFGVICGMRTIEEQRALVEKGAAWTVSNIAHFQGGSMEDAMNSYIDERRSQKRRPFIDGPHFELVI